MNCEQLNNIIDSYIDGELEAAEARAVATHLVACDNCHKIHLEILDIRALLQQQSIPGPSKNFSDNAFSKVAQSRHRSARFATFSGAIAAGLAAWFIITGILISSPTEQISKPVELTMVKVSNEISTIKLAIESERVIDGVEMSIELTPNLELAGFGTRQSIKWDTQLRKGTNIIRLPVIGLASGSGEITTRVRMNGKEKIMRIQTVYQAPGNAWGTIHTPGNA